LRKGWETDALNPPQDRFFASIDPALLNCNGAEQKATADPSTPFGAKARQTSLRMTDLWWCYSLGPDQ
jgi:hypothetical protein